MKIRVALMALAVAAPAAGQSPLALVASAGDLTLPWDYADLGIESRCGTDGFVIAANQWFCVRRNAGGALAATQVGLMPAALDGFIVVRPPTVTDRRLLLAAPTQNSPGNPVAAFDPVTLAVEDLGTFAIGGLVGQPVIRVDVEGDGIEELVLTDSPPLSWRSVSLPTSNATPSQVIRTYSFRPLAAAQIDADPQDELVVVSDTGELQFYDASTLQLESFQPAGNYFTQMLVRDWDADGIDEIAIRTRTSTVALIDPNGVGSPLQIASGYIPLDVIDWQGPGSQDLVLWSNSEVRVFDPQSGAQVGQAWVPTVAQERPQSTLRADWDNDGDMDLVWPQVSAPTALWRLRNNDGLTALQPGAAHKIVAGSALIEGEPVVVTVESFAGSSGLDFRLRSRDPQSLAVIGDAPLSGADVNSKFVVADFHPAAGFELMEIGQTRLRLRALDGTELWSRNIELPFDRRFLYPVFPDFTCSGDFCRRVLLLDRPVVGTDERLRLFDTANGTEVWTLETPDFAVARPLGLSDLDTDGASELFYREIDGGTNHRMVALDGITRNLRWQHSDLPAPLRVARTQDQRQRLAVLAEDASISYLEPATGTVLRVGPATLSGSDLCLGSCEIAYLSQGETQGVWVTTNLQGFGLSTRMRDLRSPRWSENRYEFVRGMAVFGRNRVILDGGSAVRAYQDGEDGMHTDEFEGW